MFTYIRNIRKRHYVILALFTTIYLFNAMCTPRQEEAGPAIRNVYGQVYSGSAPCQTCHKEIYKSFTQTAHYRDSRPASEKTILGSFDSGRNRFIYHGGAAVVMERKDSGFFETAYRDGQQYRTASIDIVIGSGKKGQTYLYWNDEKLFQLPISYFTPLDSWCNSPGYTIDSPVYNRRVPAQCLECHATNARTVFRNNTEYGDAFDKSQIMYGIDCEKCHGPGAQHVAFHTTNPGETVGRYIVNTGRLTRRQKLDACALCHSGSRIALKPASLAFGPEIRCLRTNFPAVKYNPANGATLDVHGNQYGLLSSSKCFIRSQMDCGSCHNVHANEAGNVKLFSQRCMNCHNPSTHDTCTVKVTTGGGGAGGRSIGMVLADNCIDCHMPALPSQRIILALSNVGNTSKSVNNLVRTHHIAIYK